VRQAILDATPLPQAVIPVAPESTGDSVGGASPAAGAGTAAQGSAANHNGARPVTAAKPGEDGGEARRARSRQRNGTKTARFLALAQDKYGPLAEFDLASVYRVSAELAPKVRLNTGSA
jgi:hypothetical protein